MKIAFVGKGGSGKTTVAALFARHLVEQGKTVLAIDADINQHFGEALGFSSEEMKRVTALGHAMGRVREYFRGDNQRIKADATFRMTTPPGRGSRFIRDIGGDEFVQEFSVIDRSLYFMTTGDFEDKDVGMICYHGKTMATEILLNHLIDRRDEYVVVDMTAGADAFSTGIFFKFDMLVLVVEPTQKSVDVYRQYREFLNGTGIRLGVIANKVQDEADVTFIKQAVGQDLVAVLPLSQAVRRSDRGERPLLGEFESGLRAGLADVQRVLDSVEKNWEVFYRQLIDLHKKHAASWLNDSFKMDFNEQIDPEFSMEDAAGT